MKSPYLLLSLVLLILALLFLYKFYTLNKTYENITAQELNKYLISGKDIYLIDVHIPEQKHISQTDAFIPYNELLKNKDKLPKNKNTKIVVYCRSGSMSKSAAAELTNMGYTNVKNLEGGINSWEKGGYE